MHADLLDRSALIERIEHAVIMSDGATTIFSMVKRNSKYTLNVLAPLVESSKSVSEVITKLGLEPTGGSHRFIYGRIRHVGLDTSHFGVKLRLRVESIPAAELGECVRASLSLAQVLTHYKLPTVGRAHHEMKRRLEDLGIDTSHFRGQGWNRGETEASNASVAKIARKNRIPDDELFVENSRMAGNGPMLTRRLLTLGWAYNCFKCGIAEWCGKSLVLHVDHINGIPNDNRLENLRFLCPNCHSQTDTFCNKARPSRASEPQVFYSCYTTATASVP